MFCFVIQEPEVYINIFSFMCIFFFNFQSALTNNLFVCGSLSRLPGLRARLQADLRRFRPAGSEFR